MPAAIVSGVAASVRHQLCRAWSERGADDGNRGRVAAACRIPGRPLRRAPVSDRRRAGDVARDCTDGLRDRVSQILALALISGIGNSVFHPCDYAILAGSIRKERMGRSFALHGFSGNIGFALAPPTIAALLSVMDWRSVLLVVGGLGLPVVAAVIAQSHILRDQVRKDTPERGMSMRALLLDRTRPVLPVLFPRRHGERRRNGVADHRAARGERARPCARLGRAHRLYGRERRRRAARRVGGRQIDPLPRLLRRRPDQLLRGGDSGRQSRADGRPRHHRADAGSRASRSAPAGRRAM